MTGSVLTPAQAAAQSLASGAAGTALLHIELALTGTGTWQEAAATVASAASGPIDGSPSGCLLHGAPALAFMLHGTGADGQTRYQETIRELTRHVRRVAQLRLAAAQERIRAGQPGVFDEHDLFYGLTGIGVVLLRTAPGDDTLASILTYLAGLVIRPLSGDGLWLPGWWSDRDPDPLSPTPGGHANLGMAHGIAGVLAFLSRTAISGCTVDNQVEAIGALCDWFGHWRQESAAGTWWPQWLTRSELRTGRAMTAGPGRPSWCYGTPGIAGALQLAAIATGSRTLQDTAEHAMADSLASQQIARLASAGLCHGIAGLHQAAVRAESHAVTTAITGRLPLVAAALGASADSLMEPDAFITGSVGVRLALETADRSALPISGWDACLLLA